MPLQSPAVMADDDALDAGADCIVELVDPGRRHRLIADARAWRYEIAGRPGLGTATEDLNATILEWAPGAGPQGEHVNAERDVVVVVVSGSLELELDGEPRTVEAGEVAVVEKGRRRRLTAGPEGVRYVTVHRKRPGLTIATLSAAR